MPVKWLIFGRGFPSACPAGHGAPLNLGMWPTFSAEGLTMGLLGRMPSVPSLPSIGRLSGLNTLSQGGHGTAVEAPATRSTNR
jgi:hypothetical protein